MATVLTKAGFVHGFSTRIGGVTPAPHGALDFSLLRDPSNLAENLRRFARAAGFDEANIYQSKQVHGARVLSAVGAPDAMHAEEADAIVTVSPDRTSGAAHPTVAVRVADCVPVLVANCDTGNVAAIHAGWRGVVAQVVGAAVVRLEAGRKVAAIGPSIGPCCFEVSVDVAEQIASAAGEPRVVVARYGDGKAKVDLRLAVRSELVRAGLDDDAIEDVPGCTRCDPLRFHSYRRDGDGSGRLLGAIRGRAARRA